MDYFNDLISTDCMNLFLIQEKGKNGYYAESLDNGVVCYISNLTNRINFLSDEKLVTYNSKVPLENLFQLMKRHKKDIPNTNAPKNEIKKFFRSIVPEYNEKRVLIKYLRQIINQFTLLLVYEKNNKTSKHISDKWDEQDQNL
jgi:hypothetical protein